MTAAWTARLGVDRSAMTAMTVISRAVVAGIVGGALTALFVVTIGETSIEAAIAIEESVSASAGSSGSTAAGPDSAMPVVSRSVQVAGGAVAVILYGVLSGIVFGTVLAAVRHRITVADDFRRSLLLAAAGFAAVGLLPAVKYPANPPAVGDPDTIGRRTLAYLTLVAAGLVLAAACALIHRRLRARSDEPTALVLTILAAVGGAVLLGLAWPDSPDTVPASFPASLLWQFRLQSLAALAIHWTALGLGTGWLLTRPVAAPAASPASLA